MSKSLSRGKTLEEKLHAHLAAFQRGPTTSDRQRPVIWGITSKGMFVREMTVDLFLDNAGRILLESDRVYRWANTLVYEFRDPEKHELHLLSVQAKAEPNATSLLTNLFCVGVRKQDEATQSLVPANLINALLADEHLWHRLPEIKSYSRRPIYDEQFVLRRPGWHPEVGILIHGPDITPAVLAPFSGGPSSDRLPPFLKRLLQDFCWASDADLENALAMLLTGFLSNRFIENPKPMGLVDGNQQEIGKTLLVQAIGQVLDGIEPARILLTKDEELEKKIGAKLREAKSSLFFFDNLRSKLDSPFIEANAPSPILSVRWLGHSREITRPNVYLWFVTSNLTSGSSDVVSRGIPIRLRYEGNPIERSFAENLLEFASQYRLTLLGELAGMIERWKLEGRPNAKDIWPAGRRPPRHRWQRWADLIGGILAVNGFTNFLSNVEEARAAMDEGLQALATLAEYAIGNNLNSLINPPEEDRDRGKLPREWAMVFQGAEIYRDKLTDKTPKARDTWIGTYLSGKTDRPVPINDGTSSGTAILRRNPVRNDQKRYYFEVTLTNAPSDLAPNQTEVVPTAPEKKENSHSTSPPNGAGSCDSALPAAGSSGQLGDEEKSADDLEWV